MKNILIDVLEAIGCDVKSEVNAKIRELHKKAILPSKLIHPLEGFDPDESFVDIAEEECKLVLEPRMNKQFGYRQTHYTQYVDNPFEVFKHNLAENNVLAFHTTCNEKYSLLSKYEEYIKSKNILLINREEEYLRNHFMKLTRVDEALLNQTKNNAFKRISDSVDKVLSSPNVLSKGRNSGDKYSTFEAYEMVQKKFEEQKNLNEEQKKYEAKCKSFGMNFIISILILIAVFATGFGLYMTNLNIIALILGGVASLAWVGFVMALFINNVRNKKMNEAILQRIKNYDELPELYKYKNLTELKKYTKKSLEAYVESNVLYILRGEKNYSSNFDKELISKILVDYEKDYDFDDVVANYVKLQLFFQLGLNEYGEENPQSFAALGSAMEIAGMLHIGKKGQIAIAVLGVLFIAAEVILKILGVI